MKKFNKRAKSNGTSAAAATKKQSCNKPNKTEKKIAIKLCPAAILEQQLPILPNR